MEKRVTEYMLEAGVPAHLKGYHYLRSAIVMTGENMVLVSSITKLLYPEIAKQYHTTSQKVERAIRNAIEVSWIRGNQELLNSLFGYCSMQGSSRPTNTEYIARIAEKIRFDMGVGQDVS